MFEEDLPAARRPAAQLTHTVGENLDFMSAEELHARAALLKAEIARLETAAAARDASRSAASAAFKT